MRTSIKMSSKWNNHVMVIKLAGVSLNAEFPDLGRRRTRLENIDIL